MRGVPLDVFTVTAYARSVTVISMSLAQPVGVARGRRRRHLHVRRLTICRRRGGGGLVVEDRDGAAADGCPVEIGGHGDGPVAVGRIVPRGGDGELNRGGLAFTIRTTWWPGLVCIRVPRAHAVVGAPGGGPR